MSTSGGSAGATTVVELDTDTTGAELTELADGSTTTLHAHAAAGTFSVWAQAHYVDGTATLAAQDADHAGSTLGDASNDGRAITELPIPTGFTTLAKAVAIVMPGTTANLRFSVATSFGADDENAAAHTDSIANTTRAVTNADLEFIDIAAAFTSIAANDIVSVRFTREGADAEDTVSACLFLGILLEYT
jgi:hypothetical protein